MIRRGLAGLEPNGKYNIKKHNVKSKAKKIMPGNRKFKKKRNIALLRFFIGFTRYNPQRCGNYIYLNRSSGNARLAIQVHGTRFFAFNGDVFSADDLHVF